MMLRVRVRPEPFWHAIARLNINQSEIAARLGISTGHMSLLVCGRRCPSPKVRRKILELLNHLTFDDLFIVEGRSDDHSP